MNKTKKPTKEIGDKGEEIAVAFLKKKGYKILNRNWRTGKLEIDIIAQLKDLIIFIEVKTRARKDFELPSDLFTIGQQKRIVSASHDYLLSNDIDLEARFDLIIIVLDNPNSEIIEHIEEAYYPTL